MGDSYEEHLKAIGNKYNISESRWSGASNQIGQASSSGFSSGGNQSSYESYIAGLGEKYGYDYKAEIKPLRTIYIPTNEEMEVNRYFSDYDRLIQDYGNRLSSIGWSDGITANSELRDSISGFTARDQNIRKYLDENRVSLNPDYYNEVVSGLDSAAEAMRLLQDAYDQNALYFGQWGSQEEYDDAVRYYGYYQKYSGMSYADLEKALGELDDGEEKEWLSAYAPTVMTERDYSVRIADLNTKIYNVEKMISDYKALRNGWGMSGDDDYDDNLISDMKGLLDQYGYQSLSAAESDLELLKKRRWELENGRRYNFLSENPDFDAMSQVAHDEATAGFGVGIGTSWLGVGDPVYDYINELDGTRHEHMAANAMNGGTPYSIYDLMNEDEIASYNYLYNTQGKDAADDYLDYLEYTLNQRRSGVVQQNAAMLADKAPIFASVISVPVNLMSGVGTIDAALQNLYNSVQEGVTGEYAGPVDYNRAGMAPTLAASTIRGTVSQNIADKTGSIQLDAENHPILSRIFNGKSLADVYQFGMSMADSAAIALLSPYIGSAGTYLLGGSAASQGILDAVANGATDEQALIMGLLNGAAEVFFEKYELENLLGADTNVIKALANQALTEAIGEGSTTIANILSDILVMQDKSEFMRSVSAYMAEYSKEEAYMMAFQDAVIQLGWDAIGGALMGSIMGSGASAVNNTVGKYSEAKQMYGDYQGDLVNEALEINPDNRYADRMQRRIDAGKDLSGMQLYRLIQQNEKAMTSMDMRNIQNAAEQRLTELGENGNVSAIAAALAKQAAGKNLSKSERQVISGSKYGQRVSNELNVRNIQSGEYTSGWAENIGTDRINAKEYSRIAEIARQAQDAGKETVSTVYGEWGKAERADQTAPGQEKTTADGNLSGENFSAQTASYEGKTIRTDTNEDIEPTGFESVGENGTLSTKGGKSVSIRSVAFASYDDAVLYNTIAKVSSSANIANTLLKQFRAQDSLSAIDFAAALMEAYEAGQIGEKTALELKAAEFAGKLTTGQREVVYNRGKRAAYQKAYQRQQDVKKKSGGKKEGKLHFERKGRKFDSVRESSLAVMDTLSKALGVDIYVYESYVNEKGQRVYLSDRGEKKAPNGYYDPSDGSIHIDLNAGQDGKGTMLFTVAHELTHFIKDWSSVKYRAMADALVKQYQKRGVTVSELVDNQIAKAKQNGRDISRQEAFDEVVADSMESMLTDENAAAFLEKLAQRDKGLKEKIVSWLKDLAAKLKTALSAYKDVKPDSPEGKMVAQMEDFRKEIMGIYTSALVDAGENFRENGGNLTSDGDSSSVVKQKFTLSDRVEQTKNLVAVHNLTEDKLLSTLKLGGFPMPSIAVTKSDIPHTNFGEISLVFGRDTIDPKANRKNTVYSADAWTPTFPKVEYEADRKVTSRVYERLGELAGSVDQYFKRDIDRARYGLNDLLNRYGGEEELIKAVMDNYGLKAAYLEEQGIHIEPTTKQEIVSVPISAETEDKYLAIMEVLNVTSPDEVGALVLKDVRDQHGAQLEEIYPGITKSALRLSRALNRIKVYLLGEGNGTEYETVTDPTATKNAVDAAIDPDKYEAWVRDLYRGVEASKGLYNGKDTYTPSGNLRSFKQTHIPFTLENIVKSMSAQNGGNTKNVSGFNGVKSLRAATAERFKSIESMHKREGRLQNITQEQLDQITDSLQDRLYEIIRRIDVENGEKGSSNSLIRYDDIGNTIMEIGEGRNFNVSDIQRVFKEAGKKVSDDAAMELKQLLFDVSQMPVNLFEAKPERVVSFSEVKAAIVPDDTNERVISGLKENGIKVLTYKNGDTADRLLKVNSVENVKFSDRDPTAEATRAALEKENGKLREDVSRLRELLRLQGKVTGGTVMKPSSVDAAARWLNKYAGAKADVKELSRMLTEFYRFIATDKDYSWEDVHQRAMVIAKYLQDNVQIKPQMSDYARDVLRDIRGIKITLDESQRAEVEYRYGSYEAFRKAAFGKVTFVKEGGIPLDSQWHEWASLYPGTFDSEITATDQPQALMDAIDALRNSDTTVMEYAYNRESIAQDLAVAVYDSYWRVDALRTVADRDQRKINDLTARQEELKGTISEKNAQIKKLRAEHRTEMDKLKNDRNETIAALKQKRQEDMKKLRTDYRKKLEDTRTRYQESREKAVDSRNRAKMREQVKKTVNELNHLLLDGDKKRHVPESMRKAVAEILSAVNMETSTAEARSAAFERTVARYNQRIKMENDPTERARLEAARDAYIGKGDQFKAKIDALAKAYEDIKESADPGLQDAYSDAVSQYLFTLEARVGDTRLGDMTLDQLKTVQEVLRIVLSTIRNANKSFLNERAGTIEQQAKRCISEVSSVWRKKKEGESDVGRWLRGFHYRNLKPIYLMRAIGSDALTQAYNNLRQGEDTWYRDIQGGREFFLSQSGKYGYGEWDFENATTFSDNSGGEVKLTLGQIMSLYAYSKREAASEHLRIGGVVIEGEAVRVNKLGMKVTYHLNDATSHQLGPEELGKIIGTLTKEQMAFVDAMQDYLSTVMADKGNEVSLAMYGIKLFREKNYFPIKSAKQFVDQKNEPVGEVKLKNSGFTNKTVPKANNPMVLRGFMDVWADHVNEMSTYHAFVLAIEDFNRIINYQTERKEGAAPVSLKQTIQNYMGQEAVSAVRELIQSVNGGARVDPAATFASKAINMFKKNAVFASASVVIQQPSAIVRAAALIDPKYFSGKIIDREKVNTTWEIIKKYAPVAGIKDMGYFDTNMGKSTVDYIKGPEHDGVKDVLTGIVKREKGSFDELLSMAPGYADKVTWCAIWEAVKRETAAKHPNLATRSEEFLKICGERFTEVITKTQVYDSVFARSGNMRSKDTGIGMATSFMAEPTTSINMIYDAVLQWMRGDKTYAARAIGAVIGAAVLNAVLKSIVYAARDDDDDETFGEKYVSALVAALKDDVLFLVPNSIPFVRDIMSLVQGYSVERMDMELADDLISAVKKLHSDKASSEEKILGVLGSFGNLLFPAKNMIREVKALINVIDTFRNSESQTAMGIRNAIREGWSGKMVSNAQQLYEARMAGDTAHEARIAARYENEKSANAAVVSAIREAFMGDDLSEEEAQKHLILYGNTDAGDAYWKVKEWIYSKDKGSSDGYGKYNDLYEAARNGRSIDSAVEELTSHGHKKEDVISTLKSQIGRWYYDPESDFHITRDDAVSMLEQYTDLSPDEIFWTMDEWDYRAENGNGEGYSRYNKIFDAILSGGDIQSEIAKFTGNGYEEDTVLENIRSKIKEWAFPDKDKNEKPVISEKKAEKMLQRYGGMTEYDAKETVADWKFEADHGYAYSDIKSTYMDEEITREEAIAVMTEIGGKSREEAEQKVAYWDYEDDTGVDYENRAQQYKRGIITRQQLRQALIDLGEYSGADADIQIEVYDWEQSGLRGASFTRVKNWHEYCEPAGVSRDMWLKIALFSANTENDKDEDGNSLRYSAMKKVMAEINKLPISKDQKTAIARAIGWSEKNIAKYKPW